jgi:hypothetical protein
MLSLEQVHHKKSAHQAGCTLVLRVPWCQGGELVVHRHGVVLVINSGQLVDLFLGNKSLCAGVGSTLSATAMSPMVLSTTPMTLDGRDIARLMLTGWEFRFL